MTLLSVNINKIATLRNARGTDTPNVLQVAKDIVSFGSRGITVHPRPDERHITKKDTYELGKWIQATNSKDLEFNIEGYPSADFVTMVLEVQPQQVTLVPDPPKVLTSNAGWDCVTQKDLLKTVLESFREQNIRSSIFINPDDIDQEQLEAIGELKPDRVELYTEMYARAYDTPKQEEVTQVYKKAALEIEKLGVSLNAGHDLNQKNLKHLVSSIPQIKEVSIGHALICEALYDGLQKTVKNYLDIL